MAVSTYSKFYYGHTITQDNQSINFNEGGAELTATLTVGTYSLEDFATELARALNEAGALTYTVTVARSTRFITIAATGTFALLVATGSLVGSDAYSLIGFTGSDRTAAATYTGNVASGSSYSVQFYIQNYVGTDQLQGAIDASVNKSTSGVIEVVSFGTEKFMECEIKFITDRTHSSASLIRNNASGVSNFVTFMQYLITKAPIEFMIDEDTPSSYQTFILESTEESDKGVKYRLIEEYDRGLPGYYRSGKLVFRLQE